MITERDLWAAQMARWLPTRQGHIFPVREMAVWTSGGRLGGSTDPPWRHPSR